MEPRAERRDLAASGDTGDQFASHIGDADSGRSHLPIFSPDTPPETLDRMVANATEAANFLKAISHEGRLMILCYLASGEKSVTELEQLLSARQSAVSQQLTRLRLEGFVTPRRDGKTIYYSLTDERSTQIIELVYRLFCLDGNAG